MPWILPHLTRRSSTSTAAKAKQQWGATAAYQEYETKNAHETTQAQQENARALMALSRRSATCRRKTRADPAVQAQVQKLQAFITEHYYTCTKEILHSLGQMYGAGGDLPRTSTRRAAPARRSSPRKAIERYCCG